MAIVMDQCIGPVRGEHCDVPIISIADDVTILTYYAETSDEIAAKVKKALSENGLEENASKEVTLGPESAQAAKFLGAHVGKAEYVRKEVQQVVDGLAREVTRFSTVVEGMHAEDAPVRHTAFRALKANFQPKLVFLMQHHPVAYVNLEAADRAMLDAVGQILGLSSGELKDAESQLRLPTSRGGFGLTPLQDQAVFQRLGALIRSFEFTLGALQLQIPDDLIYPVFPEMTELVGDALALSNPQVDDKVRKDLLELLAWNSGELTEPGKPALASFRTIQRRLTDQYHADRQRAWLEAFPKTDLQLQELLASISQPEAGRPLNVITSYRPNHIHDAEFLQYVRRRLRIPVISDQVTACALCDQRLDRDLEHAFRCKHIGRNTIHTTVKQAVFRALSDVAAHTGDTITNEPALAPYVKESERANINPDDSIKLRRGDIAVTNSALRTQVIIDVRHCTMKTPRNYLDIGCTTREGEKEKLEFYKKHFEFPESTTLMPFAIDSRGRWNTVFKEWLSAYCKKAAKSDTKLYNILISRARDTIQVGHTAAMGREIIGAFNRCVYDDEKAVATLRRPRFTDVVSDYDSDENACAEDEGDPGTGTE
jgi:hypothetical protein